MYLAHPQYYVKTDSTEGDYSELVGDNDSEGFGITLVSSGLYNVLQCTCVSLQVYTSLTGGATKQVYHSTMSS